EGRRIARIHLQMESPYSYALMIPQSETERLLAEHLATFGLRVERHVELMGFQQDGHGVTCALRNSTDRIEEVRARWLLGCDGAHSTIRHTLGIEFSGDADPN